MHRVQTLLNNTGNPNSLFNDLFSQKRELRRLISSDRFRADDRSFVDEFYDEPISYVDNLQFEHGATWYRNESDKRVKVATTIVNKTYYLAKNWAYSQDQYFDELEFIQRRIDFSRSCFLIGSWTLAIVVVATTLRLMSFVVPRMRASWRDWRVPQYSLSGCVASLLLRTLIASASCIILCALTREEYALAENNFNERAFGYFVTHLDLTTTSETKPQVVGKLGAELWMQVSGEYESICRGVYSEAWDAVTAQLSAAAADAPPPAVILDIDETVLRNAGFQSRQLLDGEEFSDGAWREWVTRHAEDVESVPGAIDFIELVRSHNLIPVFISNRPDDERDSTLRALRHINILRSDDEVGRDFELHLSTGNSSKEPRLAAALAKYRVLAIVGDQLGDFPLGGDAA